MCLFVVFVVVVVAVLWYRINSLRVVHCMMFSLVVRSGVDELQFLLFLLLLFVFLSLFMVKSRKKSII